jgi:anthranilate synthase/aminodeoxychorismate synthase-like glutamine amidotransferase
MILIVDNYDSFTYNIAQAYQLLGERVVVVRNTVGLADILGYRPSLIVIGPGPGKPQGAGISKACIELGLPVFGICLGHQAIGEVFGGQIVRAAAPMHGKTSPIYHANLGVFVGLQQGFLAARYHSLVIEHQSLTEELSVTAWTSNHEIMGIAHKELPIQGVQFHPESIASQFGLQLLKNSLKPGLNFAARIPLKL